MLSLNGYYLPHRGSRPSPLYGGEVAQLHICDLENCRSDICCEILYIGP